jgi:FAD/FMN-containing dehydrogenase
MSFEGGLSFYSSREGFICDNIVNFEVVVASGEILNANAQENQDLWVALRGGGNNLGMHSPVVCSRPLPSGHIKSKMSLA